MTVMATAALVKMIYASLIAGLSVALVFSIAVFGVTRSNDMRRAHRPGASARYAAVGMFALFAAAAIAIVGLVLVIHKG
jgi:hypothetical protein